MVTVKYSLQALFLKTLEKVYKICYLGMLLVVK